MKLQRRFRQQLYRFNSRRKGVVSLEFHGWLPRLRLLEKYETIVKWTLRAITVVGIATAAIALPWYAGILLAAGLVAVEQFIERSVFLYVSLFVQPIPTFNYDSEEWLGMLFGRVVDFSAPQIVAPYFRTEEYAREFFELLRAWNYYETKDEDNNICVSFIIEGPDKYSAYLYANTARTSVRDAARQVEGEALREKPGKEHFQIVMGLVFCKMFDYSADSQLERFRRSQARDQPFWLGLAVQGANGPELRNGDDWILKFHCKIKGRDELMPNDFECQHGKLIIGA